MIASLERPAYAALRIVAGVAFSFHGMQKVFGWATERVTPVGSQLWVGGLIEIICGTLIALGLFTRCAAFVASGTMAVAYLQFHWKLSLSNRMWLPAINHGELALIYSFLFLYMSAHGGGAASVDEARQRVRFKTAP